MKKNLALAGVLSASLVLGTAFASNFASANVNVSGAKRVLLISVDGLHETDLANYVKANPTSNFA